MNKLGKNMKLNIEGYKLAEKHGVALEQEGTGQIYVSEEGDIIKIIWPTIQSRSTNKKYPQFSFCKTNYMVHQVVASTFLGSSEEWISNGSPPPAALIESEGKSKANDLWKNTPSEVKIALAKSAIEVDHIDDDPDNYKLENLQYMYSAENNAKTPGGVRKKS